MTINCKGALINLASPKVMGILNLTPDSFYDGGKYKNSSDVLLQENIEHKVDEGEQSEFIGIINYAIMALIQIDKGIAEQPDLNIKQAISLYDEKSELTKKLMEDKNHDYGEAWREMRVSSLTDLILQKLLRVKQIEDNKGETLVSEGIDANYQDIVNYAVFALIHLSKQ